ncbi:SAM-dependent methyltransferase [Plantactinospora siamensis]|uniref:SAM-dependent methyltransferase n=1 Tax=Plantactinospora siamensis TaxID=555372 RepID=A0ABV6NWH8_9ACTN
MDGEAGSRIDTSVPHPARRYDYWLGGKDNFAADRESGDAVAAAFPAIRTAAVENRRFLRRAVRYLAAEAGMRQFLDIGTGIPAADNTHEVAQAIAPDARVGYVDNDPIVLAHARALLTGSDAGRTAYLDADLREPEKILAHPDLLAILDFGRPVAVLLVAVLHFIRDDEDPVGLVRRLVDAVPSGSYLVISHATLDFLPPEALARVRDVMTPAQGTFVPRDRAAFARFFDGLDLVAPGIGSVVDWRPDGAPGASPADAAGYGAVARKP